MVFFAGVWVAVGIVGFLSAACPHECLHAHLRSPIWGPCPKPVLLLFPSAIWVVKTAMSESVIGTVWAFMSSLGMWSVDGQVLNMPSPDT